MLFGGFAPPAARQTSAVFFIVIAPTEILHFYLELADIFFLPYMWAAAVACPVFFVKTCAEITK